MIATAPPSTDQAAPVTVLARALQRKTTTSATSAGLGEAPERHLVALGLQRLLAAVPRAAPDWSAMPPAPIHSGDGRPARGSPR